jgi:hypothetical protein
MTFRPYPEAPLRAVPRPPESPRSGGGPVGLPTGEPTGLVHGGPGIRADAGGMSRRKHAERRGQGWKRGIIPFSRAERARVGFLAGESHVFRRDSLRVRE